jgi:hypothetical protein
MNNNFRSHVRTFVRTQIWVYRQGAISSAFPGPFNPNNRCNLLARERNPEQAIRIASSLLETMGEK